MKFHIFPFRFYSLLRPTKLHRKCRIASESKNFYRSGVKHSGKATLAALKLIVFGLITVIVLLAALYLGAWVGAFVLGHYRVIFGVFLALLLLFVLFTLYFFRDPNPLTPTGANLVVSPAHGK